MQLAVITDEISQDLDRALSVMAEYGIAGAEIRGAWGVNISEADDVMVKRISDTVKTHGATVIGIATPVYKCDLPTVDGSESGASGLLHGATAHGYDEQVALLKRCMEVARALDTNFIRVFTFWKKGEYTAAIEDAIVEAFREPARLAEAGGFTLLIENEHACYTGTGIDTARLLARIDSPAVRSVWDPGNALMAAETPFPDGYDAIKRFVSHVHVKDGNAAQQWTVLGEGEVAWTAQVAALENDGYTGYLSLETHYSGGGDPETSTRQCLPAFVSLVRKV